MLFDQPLIDVIDGAASFKDEHTLIVNGEEIYGDKIFINTGSRPFVPPIDGLTSSKHVYLSEQMLEIKTLPRSFVIIGGGYIGLEFASMYHHFGSQVTIIQDGDLFIPREDREIAQSVEDVLTSQGITLKRNAKIVKIEDQGEESIITIEVNGVQETIHGDAILVATGRRPELSGLAIENAGIALTPRGAIATNEHLQTNKPHIYAMGDVVGGLQFTYISLDDSRIVASALFGHGSRTIDNRGEVPYSVFIKPALSRVGLSEEEAREKGLDIKIDRLLSANVPKANVVRTPQGMMKVIVDAKTDLILGAHLFSEESYEVINLFKLAMDAKIPYTVLRDNIYTHPTMSEALNDLLGNVQ